MVRRPHTPASTAASATLVDEPLFLYAIPRCLSPGFKPNQIETALTTAAPDFHDV